MTTTHETIHAVFQREYGRILAGLINRFRDFELAEEGLQDAFEAALIHWSQKGVPPNPGAWLTTAAKRKIIDQIRHHKTESFDPQEQVDRFSTQDDDESISDIPDERLKLIFTCCHPALPMEQRVALTLHTLGGLTTEEVAIAFLTEKATMAQRLVRAKRKIKQAGIPYSVPPSHLIAERIDGVLAVIYLIFTEGYGASKGENWVRSDLCLNAIHLGRILEQLIRREKTDVSAQQQAEVLGLLALMLLHHSRSEARTDADGSIVLLDQQNRSLWNRRMIQEGLALVEKALHMRAAGPYQIQAAIAALHAEAGSADQTDWPQIAALYQALLRFQDHAIIRLNLAVALAHAEGADQGLAKLEPLSKTLSHYAPFHLARHFMLSELGRNDEAQAALHQALLLTQNEAEQRYIRNASG